MIPNRHKAYILRTCNAEMKSYGGFAWPRVGWVEAPDWKPTSTCGHGLHGFLWGEGDGGLANWSEEAVWIVAGIDEWIDLDGKVKFPRAEVIFAGARDEATALLRDLGARGAIIGGTATAGHYGTATAGDYGTATAGDHGTATAGNDGTATAGYNGTATAGNHGTATAGYRGTATAGYRGTATAGDHGTICIRWWNQSRFRLAVGYVGENGIKPNTPYRVVNGKLMEASQ